MTGDDSVRGAEGPAAPSQLESDTVGAVATAAAEAAAKKRKVKRRDLKAKIRALEAEIEETRSQVPDEPLYGMTPKLEGAIVRALEQQRYTVIQRLLRTLHPAAQDDLIERMDAELDRQRVEWGKRVH